MGQEISEVTVSTEANYRDPRAEESSETSGFPLGPESRALLNACHDRHMPQSQTRDGCRRGLVTGPLALTGRLHRGHPSLQLTLRAWSSHMCLLRLAPSWADHMLTVRLGCFLQHSRGFNSIDVCCSRKFRGRGDILPDCQGLPLLFPILLLCVPPRGPRGLHKHQASCPYSS